MIQNRAETRREDLSLETSVQHSRKVYPINKKQAGIEWPGPEGIESGTGNWTGMGAFCRGRMHSPDHSRKKERK